MRKWVRARKSASTFSAILRAGMIAAGVLLAAVYLAACAQDAPGTLPPEPTETSTATMVPATLPPAVTETPTPTAAATDTPVSATETPRPTLTPTPMDCTQARILLLGRLLPSEVTDYSDYGYYLVCVDGSGIEELPTTGRPSYHDPSVSPINKLVAFATEFSDIAVLDLSGNVIQIIAVKRELDDFVWSPSWSPDGAYIAYIRDSDYLEVVHLETGTVSESLIPPDFEHPQVIVAEFDHVAWSPDGKHIALNTNYNFLFLMDVTCSAESHICSSQNFHRIAEHIDGVFSWSPDGGKLAVEYLSAVNYPRTLRIIDPQGRLIREYSPTELMQLTSLEFRLDLELLHYPIWSPDGEQIAFTDTRDVWILTLADNSLFNLTQALPMEIDIGGMMAWVPAEP